MKRTIQNTATGEEAATEDPLPRTHMILIHDALSEACRCPVDALADSLDDRTVPGREACYQVTVYDADFDTPHWARHGVPCQIMTDQQKQSPFIQDSFKNSALQCSRQQEIR